MDFLNSKYRISPCPRCKEEVSQYSPYCNKAECLAFSVTNVKLDSRGGFLTYVDTYKYPLRAHPRDIDLHFVDILKRAIISNIRFIVSLPVTSKRIQNSLFSWMGELYDATFRIQDRRPENEYSQSSQEIRRSLRKINPFKDDRWILYIVEIWETDQAYRNRGQDVLQELNQTVLQENSRKEILRLWDLVISREIIGGQLPKMKAMRKILWVFLLSKRLRNLVVEFLTELDLNEIKISIEDRYWMANRYDYDYEGNSFEERMDWKAAQDKDWIQPIIPAEKPRIAIQSPNQAFYELSEKQAQEMVYEITRLLMDNWRQNQQ